MLLAQISDLHVRPAGERYKDAVDSNRMFADAVAHLNRLDPRPDLVLITGDLVDEGLEAQYASLRTLLAGLELPYLLMPGNHDDRERLALFFSEHAYLPANGPKHYVIDQFPVRIVALDTTVPGDHHGEVDEAGLAWLTTALGAAHGGEHDRLAGVHPVQEPDEGRGIGGLQRAARLLAGDGDHPRMQGGRHEQAQLDGDGAAHRRRLKDKAPGSCPGPPAREAASRRAP